MSDKEPILKTPTQEEINETPHTGTDDGSDVQLPETMIRKKEIFKEDEKKMINQWRLFQDLSHIELPNELRLRHQAGLPELAEGTLVHGTTFDLEKLAKIIKSGIISGELLGIPEDGETNYCADFFRVPESMSIADYVSWSHGQEPAAEGSRIIKKRMEHRYLAGDNNQISIIINTHNEQIEPLLEMEAYTHGFEKMKTIITGLPVDRNSQKAKRLAAVLCGIPSSFISGLILPPRISKDIEILTKIKEIFGENVLLFDINGLQLNGKNLASKTRNEN